MDDLDFIQSCCNGDKHSWDEFLARYSRLIYCYILFVLRKGNPAITDDCAGDIFNGIICLLIENDFRKLKSFKAKNGSSFATWLRVVTIHFTIDYLRKLKPGISLEEENEQGLSLKDLIPDRKEPAIESAHKADMLQHLQECLELLDDDEEYFLELHINQGVKLGLLKDYFEVSRGAIDMQKSRIIAKLRDCFKKKGALLDS